MAGVLHLDLPSSCWEAPPRGLSLFPWAGAWVPGQMPHGAGLTATCASGLSPGTWSNRFRSPPPPAARGSFRPGDAESPDPGPADPQPRHEGGDRRVHLGERLGGGLLRGWGQRCPPGCPGTAGSPWAGTVPYSLSGSSPSGPAAPGLAPGEGTSPCPLPEEPQRLGGHHSSLLLQDLPGGWNAGSSAVASPSCPSPPQPGQPLSPKSTSCSRDCHRELARMSTWSPILPCVYSCFFLLPPPAWPGLAPLPSKQPLAGMPTHPLAFPGKQLPQGWKELVPTSPSPLGLWFPKNNHLG